MVTPVLAAPPGREARRTGLIDAQRLAAGTTARNIFIEAGPGTGKTTVAAERFGVQRFARGSDSRGVVAVSFTRSATRTLRSRVQRRWGTTALGGAHRVLTLDGLIRDLLSDLLVTGMLRWPGGVTELTVYDSWKSLGLGSVRCRLPVGNRAVSIEYAPARVAARLKAGDCTHDDVRSVLEQAFADQVLQERVATRMRQTLRALIVDEVFDANSFDTAIISLAIRAGTQVTLVGDPWQALYEFRGARPDLIHSLISDDGVCTHRLSESFRWTSDAQAELAARLRAGRSVMLPAADGADAVLGTAWRPLWQAGVNVLPLALGGFRGGVAEAVETVFLNHLTQNAFGMGAVFLGDACSTLGINGSDAVRRLRPGLQDVADMLRMPGDRALARAYGRLVSVVCAEVPSDYDDEFEEFARRVRHPARLIPGMTAHQAKGCEWGTVGVCLDDAEEAALASGLSRECEDHRKLYVACTRARAMTYLIEPDFPVF
jgi:DNA helicase-2/ATP-dependent DNA helicase PcrA